MNTQIRQIRWMLIFFMIVLFLSGLTAIPLESELDFVGRVFPPGTSLGNWIDKVNVGLHETNKDFPFIAYGFDWLAFAHFVLALLFIGPLKDPVKNIWVIEFGMMACVLIVPFALIAGHFRQIPYGWRLIDCSFGIIGIIPLMICRRKILMLEKTIGEA